MSNQSGYLYFDGYNFDFNDRKGRHMISTPPGAETKPAPMTSVLWVRNIVDSLCVCGLDGYGLAKQAGIKPESLDVLESGVWVKEIVRLWELAAETSGNQAIGLVAAQTFRPAALSVLGYSMMSSPNLHGAMQRSIRYSGSISSATTASLNKTAEGYRFAFHIMTGVIDIQRQNHEYIVMSMLKFFRWLAGQDLKPVRVEFKHSIPADLPLYQAAFDCALQFESEYVALVFSESDIERPLLTSNPQLVAVHDRAAEQSILQLGKSETTQRVRQLIVKAIPDGEPTRDDIAGKMGVSSRSLQRRLQDEGLTFHEVLDDVRRNLAEGYLGDEKISLADVASLLGFSDQSSFTRAARRWFDAAPSKVRAELLARRK
jgi:AraC-like DNA-binding protein